MMANGPAWRILVVDDEENLNWSLVHSLRKEGYAAEGAATGQEAQRRLAEAQYDCVVSDVMMPGMDGFELLVWIRRWQPDARVIMMTAFGSPTSKQEALNSGVVAYLEKPFDLHVLKDELARLARQAPAAPPVPGDEYDLLDVAQVLALAKRDMALTVGHAGVAGRLRFLQGELVWAEYGAVSGDEAFVALGAARTIRMQPEPWDGRGERNVAQPLSRLTYLSLARREGRLSVSAGSQPDAPATPLPRQDDAPAALAQAPSLPAQLSEALAALAHDLPQPCGAAVLRIDGSALGHTWAGRSEAPASVFTHLGQSALAASRGLLVGDLGSMEEMRLLTADWHLWMRRIGRADRALLLAVLVPRPADPAAVASILDAHTALLADLAR